MAAIAFDPLEYTHQLEASGVPRAQAEVHARAMTATFLHNFDALVTKDYLDVRFTEFETRVEARMEQRLTQLESRLESRMDARFTRMEERFARVDERFAQVDERFADIDVRLERMNGKFNLVYWMQGLTIVCVVVPVLRNFLG